MFVLFAACMYMQTNSAGNNNIVCESDYSDTYFLIDRFTYARHVFIMNTSASLTNKSFIISRNMIGLYLKSIHCFAVYVVIDSSLYSHTRR